MSTIESSIVVIQSLALWGISLYREGMKLYSHTVAVPFDYGSIDPNHYSHNQAVHAWWRDRRLWLSEQGITRYHAYRVGEAYTCVVDGRDPPPGNNNVGEVILWTFEDSSAALLFKLTWG